VIHFPVSKRMPLRVAEEKLGPMTMFKSPDEARLGCNVEEWVENWISTKSVLLGWEAVKEGLAKSFKGGRVRHLVSKVEFYGGRPVVETACGVELHPVFNWESDEPVKDVPVIILGMDQTSYFRVCKHCLARSGG